MENNNNFCVLYFFLIDIYNFYETEIFDILSGTGSSNLVVIWRPPKNQE